ncbi:predicted protein [Chaetomium globosum CBS 148.51]|uniref:Uncharacterized protein n=1 Tax=Chaetomium globosum (strain ATCC 6205 / CBS 148.51 / DSM 1962 / NBRC 6347 / NRRL 1970) TaxID=306901 RepID=Q2H4L1_CHAGB|nr:uncharacterized protein CHGG_06404 [Chaetomium globosum CBS 148.51]EAQ89785.1 predicted protein [Chaetomium globosum CBS 148.51]
MDPFSIPITPVAAPHIEVDPSLRTVTQGDAIDAPVPEVFRSIGFQYDWNLPLPFWNYLGRIVAKGVFNDQLELENLNCSAVGRREFVAYTTSAWKAAVEARKAAGEAERPPLNVIEVKFKKPQPGQPIEMTWTPARALISTRVARMKRCGLKTWPSSRRRN